MMKEEESVREQHNRLAKMSATTVTSVTDEPTRRKELEEQVAATNFDPKFSDAFWRIEDVQLIDNQRLTKSFINAKDDMKLKGRSDDELREVLVFSVENQRRVGEISREGPRVGLKKRHVLGYTGSGVHVVRHYDVLTRYMAFQQFVTPSIVIVYKCILGKQKPVYPRLHKDDNYVSPHSLFDCHVSSRPVEPRMPIREALNCSYVYLYQFEKITSVPARCPKQILPYAVLTLHKKHPVFISNTMCAIGQHEASPKWEVKGETRSGYRYHFVNMHKKKRSKTKTPASPPCIGMLKGKLLEMRTKCKEKTEMKRASSSSDTELENRNIESGTATDISQNSSVYFKHNGKKYCALHYQSLSSCTLCSVSVSNCDKSEDTRGEQTESGFNSNDQDYVKLDCCSIQEKRLPLTLNPNVQLKRLKSSEFVNLKVERESVDQNSDAMRTGFTSSVLGGINHNDEEVRASSQSSKDTTADYYDESTDTDTELGDDSMDVSPLIGGRLDTSSLPNSQAKVDSCSTKVSEIQADTCHDKCSSISIQNQSQHGNGENDVSSDTVSKAKGNKSVIPDLSPTHFVSCSPTAASAAPERLNIFPNIKEAQYTDLRPSVSPDKSNMSTTEKDCDLFSLFTEPFQVPSTSKYRQTVQESDANQTLLGLLSSDNKNAQNSNEHFDSHVKLSDSVPSKRQRVAPITRINMHFQQSSEQPKNRETVVKDGLRREQTETNSFNSINITTALKLKTFLNEKIRSMNVLKSTDTGRDSAEKQNDRVSLAEVSNKDTECSRNRSGESIISPVIPVKTEHSFLDEDEDSQDTVIGGMNISSKSQKGPSVFGKTTRNNTIDSTIGSCETEVTVAHATCIGQVGAFTTCVKNEPIHDAFDNTISSSTECSESPLTNQNEKGRTGNGSVNSNGDNCETVGSKENEISQSTPTNDQSLPSCQIKTEPGLDNHVSTDSLIRDLDTEKSNSPSPRSLNHESLTSPSNANSITFGENIQSDEHSSESVPFIKSDQHNALSNGDTNEHMVISHENTQEVYVNDSTDDRVITEEAFAETSKTVVGMPNTPPHSHLQNPESDTHPHVPPSSNNYSLTSTKNIPTDIHDFESGNIKSETECCSVDTNDSLIISPNTTQAASVNGVINDRAITKETEETSAKITETVFQGGNESFLFAHYKSPIQTGHNSSTIMTNILSEMSSALKYLGSLNIMSHGTKLVNNKQQSKKSLKATRNVNVLSVKGNTSNKTSTLHNLSQRKPLKTINRKSEGDTGSCTHIHRKEKRTVKQVDAQKRKQSPTADSHHAPRKQMKMVSSADNVYFKEVAVKAKAILAESCETNSSHGHKNSSIVLSPKTSQKVSECVNNDSSNERLHRNNTEVNVQNVASEDANETLSSVLHQTVSKPNCSQRLSLPSESFQKQHGEENHFTKSHSVRTATAEVENNSSTNEIHSNVSISCNASTQSEVPDFSRPDTLGLDTLTSLLQSTIRSQFPENIDNVFEKTVNSQDENATRSSKRMDTTPKRQRGSGRNNFIHQDQPHQSRQRFGFVKSRPGYFAWRNKYAQKTSSFFHVKTGKMRTMPNFDDWQRNKTRQHIKQQISTALKKYQMTFNESGDRKAAKLLTELTRSIAIDDDTECTESGNRNSQCTAQSINWSNERRDRGLNQRQRQHRQFTYGHNKRANTHSRTAPDQWTQEKDTWQRPHKFGTFKHRLNKRTNYDSYSRHKPLQQDTADQSPKSQSGKFRSERYTENNFDTWRRLSNSEQYDNLTNDNDFYAERNQRSQDYETSSNFSNEGRTDDFHARSFPSQDHFEHKQRSQDDQYGNDNAYGEREEHILPRYKNIKQSHMLSNVRRSNGFNSRHEQNQRSFDDNYINDYGGDEMRISQSDERCDTSSYENTHDDLYSRHNSSHQHPRQQNPRPSSYQSRGKQYYNKKEEHNVRRLMEENPYVPRELRQSPETNESCDDIDKIRSNYDRRSSERNRNEEYYDNDHSGLEKQRRKSFFSWYKRDNMREDRRTHHNGLRKEDLNHEHRPTLIEHGRVIQKGRDRHSTERTKKDHGFYDKRARDCRVQGGKRSNESPREQNAKKFRNEPRDTTERMITNVNVKKNRGSPSETQNSDRRSHVRREKDDRDQSRTNHTNKSVDTTREDRHYEKRNYVKKIDDHLQNGSRFTHNHSSSKSITQYSRTVELTSGGDHANNNIEDTKEFVHAAIKDIREKCQEKEIQKQPEEGQPIPVIHSYVSSMKYPYPSASSK